MVPQSGPGARVFLLAPLLVLLFFSASVAAPFSTEKAYRAARAAADADDRARAQQIARQALAQNPAEDQWGWALKVLDAEISAKLEDAKPIGALKLPEKYATSEAAVFQQLALFYATGKKEHVANAEKLAANHQPRLLLYVHLLRINTEDDYETHAKKALALAKDNPLYRANALNALTRRRVTRQEYRAAVQSGEQALQLYTRAGAVMRLATAAGNLGWAYYEVGNRELAEELFVKAERMALQNKDLLVRSIWINQLGNVRFADERFDEALRHYQQARELTPTNAAVLTNLARTSVERGDYAGATRFVNEALRHARGDQTQRALIVQARIAAVRGDYAGAEKTLRDVAKNSKGATLWTAQSQLALLYVRMRRPAEAKEYFREAIGTAREVRNSIDNLELSISFFNTAREVFDGYVNFLVDSGRKEEALAATELIRQQENDRTIDARVFAKRTGATILCYWLGRDRSYVWRVTPTAVVHTTIEPKKTIALEVGRHSKALQDPRPRVSAAHGRKLYDMLVAPVASKLAKDARVFIIADGELHALNFETLIPPAAPQHYWIEDVILSSAASLQPPAPRKPAADAKMLLVGDPVPSKEFPRLAQASKEIDTVASHFQRRVVLRGAKATAKGFHAAAPQQFEFLHFAAHGEAVRKRPFDSAVILSPDGANGYRLFARDIAALELQARVVTISSCYGAGDRTFAGEGLVGLAWAFSSAGADNVIAALTKVDDSIAPQLMDEMYREIRKGEDVAVALRKAKLKFVRGGGAYSTPRYWAPFVLYSGS